MTTDTPRTDAEVFEIQDCNGQLRKVITTQFAKQLERELAHSLANQVKAQAEVEHIKALLKDIPAVHTNTLRGNIATLSWDSYEHIIGPHPCRERAENAEAEVERLNSELSDMECEVWPEMARLKAEVAFWKAKAHEAEDQEGKHEAEVERLKDELKKGRICAINHSHGLRRRSAVDKRNPQPRLEMNPIAETPRTDAESDANYWSETPRVNSLLHELKKPCDGDRMDMTSLARQLERELAHSLENQVKAQAEVKEIRAALGDDGRRTHKEILELATKASQWREWKKKYIDLKNAHMAEGQDPAGTIWEHADKLQKELATSKAEVKIFRKEIIFREAMDNVAQEVWDEMKAEVAELRQQKRNCLEIIDDDAKERSELKDEVERLRKQLQQAVEIAEKIWADCSNGSEHTEIAALKQGKVFVDPKWIYNLETQLAKAQEELCQAGLREYGN